ncbi:serine/threonine protein kinase [Spiromyces aspiralis]|uniref:Serine/threonine protein kinase n=1 Tax=Spiromyces aspiralis TaxID=68401 RepID=A0ACC1HSK1_9FUNG|nr:serine/threonine protein kinase [Spiromyces aspiralis]
MANHQTATKPINKEALVATNAPAAQTKGLHKPPIADVPEASPSFNPKTHAATTAVAAAPAIKRTTSIISQRLQNILHIGSGGGGGGNTPGTRPGRIDTRRSAKSYTIAYQQPLSAGPNSPILAAHPSTPSCPSTEERGTQTPPESLKRQPSEYHPVRHFEPVPADKLISIDWRNLPVKALASPQKVAVAVRRGSVAAHDRAPQPASGLTGLEPIEEGTAVIAGHDDTRPIAALTKTDADHHPQPPPSQPTQWSSPRGLKQSSSELVQPSIRKNLEVEHDRRHQLVKQQQQQQKSQHAQSHYSTHEVSLNKFGRTTKVIGKGTGGTVRLLQGVDVSRRPPSIRATRPPSSVAGESESGYSPANHRLFAVKEFRRRRPDETPRAYMKKVTSEFCIGSSIHHENVIETLDLIFEGDRVYEIMEYCPHDLFTFVAMGETGMDEMLCWFKQVCQGVAHLHSLGIGHRDLKLENCLLTETGVVKLIDFGCATVFKTPFQRMYSKVTGICGSDPYIAPEVFNKNEPYSAPAADVWSVGIMYMCMALLKFPWRIADSKTDRNYASYVRDWPKGQNKMMGQLPPLGYDGLEVIKHMVIPDPGQRYTMENIMQSKWMQSIDVCHVNRPAKSHTHRLNTDNSSASD